MKREEILVVRSDEGIYLATFGAFFITPVFMLSLVMVANFILDSSTIIRTDLFQPGWLPIFSMLFGIVFPELIHNLMVRLFGGYAWYGKRIKKRSRTRLERKYKYPLTLRSWAPGVEFSFFQYLLILLSPVMVFLFFPLTMTYWQNPTFFSVLWGIGFGNSLLLPLDIILALIILRTGKFDYTIVDEVKGTYLVKE